MKSFPRPWLPLSENTAPGSADETGECDSKAGNRGAVPMALTKAEMAERLFDEVGLNKREAKEFVDAYFDVLREALEQGRQVKLSGFGNFDLRRKNQRPGRNPKTGEEIPISARTVVTFRPGQKLKERVETYAGSGQ